MAARSSIKCRRQQLPRWLITHLADNIAALSDTTDKWQSEDNSKTFSTLKVVRHYNQANANRPILTAGNRTKQGLTIHSLTWTSVRHWSLLLVRLVDVPTSQLFEHAVHSVVTTLHLRRVGFEFAISRPWPLELVTAGVVSTDGTVLMLLSTGIHANYLKTGHNAIANVICFIDSAHKKSLSTHALEILYIALSS